MATLDDLRKDIDRVDEVLVRLLNERARCVCEIGRLKKETGMAIYQPDREKQVLQHVRAIAFTLARALGATYPYRGAKGEAPEVVLLFTGAEQRLEVVTVVGRAEGFQQVERHQALVQRCRASRSTCSTVGPPAVTASAAYQ